MKGLALSCVWMAAAWAADDAKLTLWKEFPGSVPAYFSAEITRTGKVTYKEAADDPYPVVFQLDETDNKEIWELAEKLGYFSRPLESGLKVAFMGKKSFRHEGGGQKKEVSFNYTTDLDGQKLLDWFERIGESEQGFIRLERTVKYDKLGVHQAILYLQAAQDKKRLVGLDQYLPLLDRVIKNESYLHMARERASQLADLIRTRHDKPAEATPSSK
jgi:hypothetical protein